MNEQMMDEYQETLKQKIDVVLTDQLKTAAILGLSQVEAHAATTAAVMNCLQFLMGLAIRLGWATEDQMRKIFTVAVATIIKEANHGEKDVNTHSD